MKNSQKKKKPKKTSSLNYIYVSYEIAKLYFEQNNLDTSIKYLEISKKQILLSKNIDKNLLDNINVLNSKINENV
ncbi:MAG: hypothetical protein IJA34_03795 [Lachnospiraceae bacterium]|nr:hypothetical protein [Lachnospiraceae bacterium]